MRWKGRRASANVDDRRRLGGRGIAGGGAAAIILLLIFTLLGGDPSVLINSMQSGGYQSVDTSYIETPEEQELAEFASVVLADTEDVWNGIFEEEGMDYSEPQLVLYRDGVETGSGWADSSVGPFYSPADNKVYIDLSFFAQLTQEYGAPGDFAMAYVIAHEIGHHVQTELGITDKVMAMQQRVSEKEFNEYMVRFELQADYLAGVWAYHAKEMGLLEEGDLEEALNAASAVGDDRLQKKMYGYAVPDSFTHGTSEQRARWFRKGFQSGSLSGGDTFGADPL